MCICPILWDDYTHVKGDYPVRATRGVDGDPLIGGPSVGFAAALRSPHFEPFGDLEAREGAENRMRHV